MGRRVYQQRSFAVAALLLTLFGAVPAAACGWWSLHDLEFQRVSKIYCGDAGLSRIRVVDDAWHLEGKPIGKIGKGEVVVGGKTYTINILPPRKWHRMPTYPVQITLAGRLVAETRKPRHALVLLRHPKRRLKRKLIRYLVEREEILATVRSRLPKPGADPLPALRTLVRLLRQGGWRARLVARLALGKIGAAAVPIVTRVTEQSKRSIVRRAALLSLSEMGAGARQAVPTLKRALKDRDRHYRTVACKVLGSISTQVPPAIPILVDFLGDAHPKVRRTAADALGASGPAAAAAVPSLSTALKDRSLDVRRSAAKALGAMGKRAVAAVPALEQLKGHTDPALRQAAARALRAITR